MSSSWGKEELLVTIFLVRVLQLILGLHLEANLRCLRGWEHEIVIRLWKITINLWSSLPQERRWLQLIQLIRNLKSLIKIESFWPDHLTDVEAKLSKCWKLIFKKVNMKTILLRSLKCLEFQTEETLLLF
jgi:hypothetical protein